MAKDSNGFFSFSDSAGFFSTETALEVLGLAPVSEGVLKVCAVEASVLVGAETEFGKTFSSVTDTAGADKLVDAKDPKDDVVEVVVASDETAAVVLLLLLSVMTVVVMDTAAELSELVADSSDAAAADEVDAAVEAGAGMWVVFLATTALYCCISITAASSNTWSGTMIS